MKKQWITINDTYRETTIDVKRGLVQAPPHLMYWNNWIANKFVAAFKAKGCSVKLETVEYS